MTQSTCTMMRALNMPLSADQKHCRAPKRTYFKISMPFKEFVWDFPTPKTLDWHVISSSNCPKFT